MLINETYHMVIAMYSYTHRQLTSMPETVSSRCRQRSLIWRPSQSQSSDVVASCPKPTTVESLGTGDEELCEVLVNEHRPKAT